MSAMILNYPPPTASNLYEEYASEREREKARLENIKGYLENGKLVKDDDLVLIVDGQDTWFQLPSEVLIQQYRNVVADAGKRLLERYGVDEEGWQRFNATVVFGAEKKCGVDESVCEMAPESTLPENIYGEGTGRETQTTAAKFLDAGMVMGSAGDMRRLYKAASERFTGEKSVQEVFAKMLGEQTAARDAAGTGNKPKAPKVDAKKEDAKVDSSESESKTSAWFSWFSGPGTASTRHRRRTELEHTPDNIRPNHDQQTTEAEFSIALDYTHTLFQTLLYPADDELVALPHDNSTDLSKYARKDTPSPPLTLPTALLKAKPPFWTPDSSKHNPNPPEKPAYIEPLSIQKDLDDMKPASTGWDEVPLIQNTYTGAVPGIFHLSKHSSPSSEKKKRAPRIPQQQQYKETKKEKKTPLEEDAPELEKLEEDAADDDDDQAPSAPLTWSSLWYAHHERALLRAYFRTPQSPLGFHKAAVGGDMLWDVRGGRGGVWTAREQVWLPWGEVDGVCGTLELLQRTFDDGKGVWLHEKEGGAEEERLKLEQEMRARIEEEQRKEEEEARKKEEEEREKKIKAEQEKADKEKEKLKEQKEKEEQEQKEKEKEEQKKKDKEAEAEAAKLKEMEEQHGEQDAEEQHAEHDEADDREHEETKPKPEKPKEKPKDEPKPGKLKEKPKAEPKPKPQRKPIPDEGHKKTEPSN